MHVAQRGQIIGYLFTVYQHGGQLFSPALVSGKSTNWLAIVTTVIWRNRRGGVNDQLVGNPAGLLEPGSSSRRTYIRSCTRSPAGISISTHNALTSPVAD